MSIKGKVWVNLKPGKVSHVVIHNSSGPFAGTEMVLSVQDTTDPSNPQDITFNETPVFSGKELLVY